MRTPGRGGVASGTVRRLSAAGASVALLAAVLVVAVPAAAAPAPAVVAAAPAAAAPPVAPPMQPVLHPLDIAPDPSASRTGDASPQSVAADASVISGVLYWSGPDDSHEVLGGATVTAFRFAADQTVLFQRSTTSAADGTFSLAGLAAGDYYVEFTAAPDGGAVGHDWYGSSTTNLYGTVIRLAESTEQRIGGFFAKASVFDGYVSCEQCAKAPDPAKVTLELTVGLPDPVGVAEVKPAADGSYSFTLRTADFSGTFVIYALYSGEGDLSAVSENPRAFPDYGGTTSQNLLIARDVASHCTYGGPVPVEHALYWDYLHRSPSESDVQFWCAPIANDGLGVVSASFVTSDEYRLIRIDDAYRTILGREPESAGRLNWLRGMRGGLLSTDDIETTFYASDEYFLQHGGTNIRFAGALYQKLLHRTGSASDYAFWAALVSQHSRAWVVSRFWDSTETITERVAAMYQLYLGRVPDASGIDSWVGVALAIGDSGLRAGLTGSAEYAARAPYRYHEVV